MSMMRPIVVAAGGTGGHIFPALAVARVLAQRDISVVWVGTRQGLEARVVPDAGIDIRWIAVAGMRGKGVFGSLIAPFKLLYACLQSIGILARVRPAAVLGMGGFVSGPVGIASLLMRRPLVLHEQNAIAGMTNRQLSRLATRVFSAMPRVFPESIHAEVVGNPVRQDITELSVPGDSANVAVSDTLRVLVIGGSRGARILNETVPAAVAEFTGPIAIRHQTGKDDLQSVQAAYDALAETRSATQAVPLNSSEQQLLASDFIVDMAEAYAWADVVVCRAGALTISELSAAGLPSILVPFPYAVDDHQSMNARYLSDVGAAVLIPQTDLTPISLCAEFARLHADRSLLSEMADKARSRFQPNAAERVADALIEVSV